MSNSESTELIWRIFMFIPLALTAFLLFTVMNSFVQLQPDTNNIFDLVCQNPSQNLPILYNYPMLKGQFFTQVIIPSEGIELEEDYPASYLEFIDAFYNPNKPVTDADLTDNSITKRENYGLLRQCQSSACLCLINTGTNHFNAQNFGEISCLHNIFSYEPARNAFASKVNDLRGFDANDSEALRLAIIHSLSMISQDSSISAQRIRDCYSLAGVMSSSSPLKSFYSETLNERFIFYESSYLESANHFYELLSNYYSVTNAGLLFSIKSCVAVPNENSCIYTKDVKGNFMSYNARKNVFLAYYSSDNKASLNGELNSEYNLIDINQLPSDRGVCMGDEDFKCSPIGSGNGCALSRGGTSLCESSTLCEEYTSIDGKTCRAKDEGVKCSSIFSKQDCLLNACAGCYWAE